MTPQQFQHLMEIFQEAAALEGEARLRVLDERCGEDADLRRELDALLGQDGDGRAAVATGGGLAHFYERGPGDGAGRGRRAGPGSGAGTTRRIDAADLPGEGDERGVGGAGMPVLSGHYRLLRVVGEGGMGIVYEAEQSFPRRTVAIKALRPTLASRGMLRRFLHEAQTLARLQHPGIAQIYEAGTADEGRPDEAFFVMEFVDGTPLTVHARERGLGPRACAELMARVCDAVQHAHQRGVIHRDLKPGNILVTREGEPKVLDFGVARVMEGDAGKGGEAAVRTMAGQLVGTLAYMSPEQVSGGVGEVEAGGEDVSAGVDTRSDVYALGVILYQLLSGALPYDVTARPIPEVARIIREQAPAPIADRRVRGDLETIARRALEKDRSRRYQSALELGEDLRRHLRGEPIMARRDSALYVLGRQVVRHRWLVMLGAAALLGVVAFAVVAAVQAARNRALAARLEVELAAANVDRGRLLFVGGSQAIGERVLWTEWMQRPGLEEAYWGLVELYARQPLLKATGGEGLQPSQMAVSPDRGTVVCTSREGEVEAWSGDLSRCLWRRKAHGQGSTAAVFAGPGLVVTGGADGVLLGLDPATGAVLHRSDTGRRWISDLAVSADGTAVAYGNSQGESGVWGVNPWGRRFECPRRADGVRSLMFTPDGGRIISSGRGPALHVYQASDGKQLFRAPLNAGSLVRIAPSADGGAILALAEGGRLLVVEASTLDVRTSLDLGDPGTDYFTLVSGGERVVTSGRRGINIWDVGAGRLVRAFPGFESTPNAIAESTEPGVLLVYGMGTSVRMLDARDGRFPAPLARGEGPASGVSVQASPDGGLVAAVSADGRAWVWSMPDRRLVASWSTGRGRVRALTWVPGRARFAAAMELGTVAVYEAATGAEAAVWRVGEADITSLAFSPDGSLLAVGSLKEPIRVLDTSTGAVVREMQGCGPWTTGLAFSPDGKRLAATAREPGLAVYDAATGRRVADVPDAYQNWRVRYIDGGRLLAVARSRPEVELRDAATLAVVRAMRGHAQTLSHADFSADGARCLTSSLDGTIRLWDVATARPLLTVDAPGASAWASFVPGTRQVVSTTAAGGVVAWDLGMFDRCIAGNMSHLVGRYAASCPGPVDVRTLEAWGRRVLGDPAFTLADPRAGVPVQPMPTAADGGGGGPTGAAP